MNPKHKALANKMSNADKALKHHQILASKEKNRVKSFGSFEERLDKYAKFKKDIHEKNN